MDHTDQLVQEIRSFRAGKRKKYPFPLDRPVYIDPAKWGPDESQEDEKVQRLTTKKHQEYRAEINAQFESRWEWLFLVYGMDPKMAQTIDGWRQLCGWLANQHVPGLQSTNVRAALKQSKPRGAPQTRGPAFYAALVVAVDEARARVAKKQRKTSEEVNNATAIRNIDRAFLEQWKGPSGKQLNDRTLGNYYDAAMKILRRTEKYPLVDGLSLATLGLTYSPQETEK